MYEYPPSSPSIGSVKGATGRSAPYIPSPLPEATSGSPNPASPALTQQAVKPTAAVRGDVVVELSPAAKGLLVQRAGRAADRAEQARLNASVQKADKEPEEQKPVISVPEANALGLSRDEVAEVMRLRSLDSSVRTEEFGHVAAAAGYANSPLFTFEMGPDGRRYVVNGSVPFDTSPADSPEATIAKAQQIRNASAGGAERTPAERQAAAAATRMELFARQELAIRQIEAARSEATTGQTPVELSLPVVKLTEVAEVKLIDPALESEARAALQAEQAARAEVAKVALPGIPHISLPGFSSTPAAEEEEGLTEAAGRSSGAYASTADSTVTELSGSLSVA
jgi:hypothetical protein